MLIKNIYMATWQTLFNWCPYVAGAIVTKCTTHKHAFATGQYNEVYDKITKTWHVYLDT